MCSYVLIEDQRCSSGRGAKAQSFRELDFDFHQSVLGGEYGIGFPQKQTVRSNRDINGYNADEKAASSALEKWTDTREQSTLGRKCLETCTDWIY